MQALWLARLPLMRGWDGGLKGNWEVRASLSELEKSRVLERLRNEM